MKALVGAFNQEKALVGAFSVIVQPIVEPMDRFTALVKYENTASGVTTWLMSRSHFLWHFGVKVRPLNDHRGRAVTVLFNWD